MKGFFKGNGTNVARIVPYSAIQFFTFDYFKRAFMAPGENSPLKTLACGALSGVVSSLGCYPLDLVRSHLTVQTSEIKYRGMLHGITTIAKEQGVRGLYRGILPTMAGIGPYVAINFFVFDTLKRKYLPDPSHATFDVINLSLGACAGFTAAMITYPTDVLRRRMQLRGVKLAGLDIPVYRNSVHCISHVVQTEGVRGMYKGLSACLLKVVPSMAIAFMTHERLRRLLKFDPKKK